MAADRSRTPVRASNAVDEMLRDLIVRQHWQEKALEAAATAVEGNDQNTFEGNQS